MKNLLFIVALLAAMYAAYDFYVAAHPLPHETTLTDKQGRTVAVRIQSVDPDHVDFMLQNNKLSYTWPIEDLNLVSKYKVLRLRSDKVKLSFGKSEVAEDPSDAAMAALSPQDRNHVKNLQEQIADIQKQINKLQLELNEPALANARAKGIVSARERSIHNEIDQLVHRQIRLQARISNYFH